MVEDVVRARRFELVDDQQRPRAALYMDAGQPILGLADEDGNARAQVAINREGSAILRFRDAGGNDRVEIAAMEDGTGLVLSDPSGRVRLSLLIEEAGVVFVSVEDHGLRRAMGAVVPGGEIALGLWDAEGNETHSFNQAP